ncbi:dihydrolipoyllysine-residue acetyltransferase [Chromatocurvus halotolerans]|uniref:Acetyltransferase component of pyruvate dehydrogenase complex n=1 Tax=Chromatocurvus halotolerans TaxID=1132028 RepID=A0A4R2KQF7_9GAMM|nr:dihydrolipoyllysine-residue acetyltransferase [Chromatocurvus halotolerans]TCO74917.1 pyruvate dehydrogenase E2 component (dihydrolipoamide acetyltransferase) [Chromatocurvus halotolerans]
MAKEKVLVPDIGGAEAAEVVELLVAVGDTIAVDDGLIVLESDKASMEIPSTVAGKVLEVLVKEGDELAEGDEVALVETAGGDAGDDAAEADADASTGKDTESSSGDADAPSEAADAADEPRTDSAASAADDASAEGDRKDGADTAEAGTRSRQTVRVPDIGGAEAAEVVELLVAVGDAIDVDGGLVVLESDKASMEVPASVAGKVVELLVKEGDQLSEGDDVAVIEVAGADSAAQEADGAAGKDTESAAADGRSAEGKAAAADGGTTKATAAGTDSGAAKPSGAERPAGQGSSATQGGSATEAGKADDAGANVYAGPAVRKLAREFAIPLDKVTGSGPRGRVLKEDLHTYAQKTRKSQAGALPAATDGAGIPPIPEVDFSAFGEVEIETRGKLDLLTAVNMQRSWLNLPHVTHFDDADITELEAFRQSMKTEAERRGTRLTPMPFLIKACAVALREHPKFNASLTDGGKSLAYKKYFHIGMAVDTPAGLMVPVIRDVDRKSLWELSAEILELAEKARERKLKPDEMRGGCFTVSSLGGIGGNGFTPIINAPEVGILGVSRAAVKPVWDGEAFQPRTLLPLTLSYDHRVINGGDAGRFMTTLTALISDIRRLVM